MATSTTQGTGVVLGFESTHAAAATYEKWVRYPNMIVPELQLRVLDESSAHDLVLMDGRYELGPHVAWPYSSSSPSQSSTLQCFHAPGERGDVRPTLAPRYRQASPRTKRSKYCYPGSIFS